jgi:hypothetical protein
MQKYKNCHCQEEIVSKVKTELNDIKFSRLRKEIEVNWMLDIQYIWMVISMLDMNLI